MSVRAKQANASLDLSGKTAVIAGGTQGIGEGIALRCAQLGVSRIFIVGRNSQRGNAVLEKLRALTDEKSGQKGGKQEFEFIPADLSTIETVKKTASEIHKRVGPSGLDYLLMTQGGPPNGIYELNSEGHEKAFAVHCLSRFGLTYLLAEKKTLKDDSTVVSVFGPGWDYQDLDLEDLSLKKLKETNPGRLTLGMHQAKRDSVMADAFAMEFNRRYPWMKYYHLFPGYVDTNASANRGLPFPIPQLGSIFGPIVARTIGNTISSYSDIPLYFAAHPEARKLDGYLFNERFKKIELGSWNQDPKNRQKAFDKLKSFF